MTAETLKKVKEIWGETMERMESSKRVSFIWSEADLEHRIGEGIYSKFENARAHFHQTLTPEMFDEPLSRHIKQFWE